jgi:hypothetical protein
MVISLANEDLLEQILAPERDEDETEELDRLEALDYEVDRLPGSATEVASFEDYVDNAPPSPSWHIEAYYFLVPLPSIEDGFALLELDWDDNWGRWTWTVEGTLEMAESRDEAARRLMYNFAKSRLSDGDTAFDIFLSDFIKNGE